MAEYDISDQEIFEVARKIDSREARQAYLRHVCGGDGALEERIRALLNAYEDSDSFLESPPPELGTAPTLDQPITERPGTVIGPYKLLQEIGHGGMGVVYMAEQTEPVERRVALKIIKPGMDTRQVIARFEAERQALAMMDHPNIAKVLDAGATDSGRPYFVMELVKGVPITEYCDEHHLSPRERLELFVPVCQAVQHAHQKGIIHRDIKPSNVLVAEYDDRAVPKIIDFGVAKAIEHRLTEKTMFTEFGQVVGTPEYMSPEQARLSQLDIDTRSDIYSLGVLLYELLVGETPFDRQRLRSAAFDELLRIIREEEPPRPSIRLSTSETLPSIAANRHIEPKKLSVLVRGELDWIVMKALEKDRTRRYETANSFANDIERYLNDEPVVACPPSVAYRLGKSYRRNKATFALFSLIVISLLALTVGSLSFAFSVQRESRERIKLNQEVSDSFAELRQYEDRAQRGDLDDEGAWFVAKQTIDRAKVLAQDDLADPELADRVDQAIADLQEAGRDRELVLALNAQRDEFGGMALGPGVIASGQHIAKPQYAEIFRQHGFAPVTMSPVEAANLIAAKPSRVREATTISLYIWLGCARALPVYLSEEEVAEKEWARSVLTAVENDPWRRRLLQERGREVWMELIRDPGFDTQPPHALLILAARLDVDDREEAAAVLMRARKLHPDDYWINLQLSGTVQDPTEALRFASVAVAMKPESPVALMREGALLKKLGRTDEAVEAYEHARTLGASCHTALAVLYERQGNLDAAANACLEAFEHETKGDASLNVGPSYLNDYLNLEIILEKTGRTDELPAILQKAIERCPNEAVLLSSLATYHYDRGNWDEAIDWLLRADARQGLLADKRAKLADALVKENRMEEAKQQYRRLIEHQLCWFISSGVHAEIARHRVGGSGLIPFEAFQQSVDLLPHDALAHCALGARLFIKEQQPRKAIEAFQEACSLDPSCFPANFNLAKALASQQEYDDAILAYQRLIEINPNYASLWLEYGQALQSVGRREDAIEAFGRSFELTEARYQRSCAEEKAHPEMETPYSWPRPDWYYSHYDALLLAGEALRSFVDLRLEEVTEEDEAEVVADIRRQLLRWAENSELIFEKNHVRADLYLGSRLSKGGRWQAAISLLESAIETDPTLATSAYRKLAHVYFEMDDREEALKMARKALELSPGDGNCEYLLDQLLNEETTTLGGHPPLRPASGGGL